jgi:hypothetical protein
MSGFLNQNHSDITKLQYSHGTKSVDRQPSLLVRKWDFPGEVGFPFYSPKFFDVWMCIRTYCFLTQTKFVKVSFRKLVKPLSKLSYHPNPTPIFKNQKKNSKKKQK